MASGSADFLIVGDGDHASPMERDGRYAMFRLQAGRYTDRPAEPAEESEEK